MTSQTTEQNATRNVDFPLGAHIVSPRRWYTHHGIYVGAGEVVHYEGLSSSLRRGRIARVSLDAFGHGHPVQLHREIEGAYCGIEIVARACSRLGEDAYDVLRNNCEHFCTWCLVGVARSPQIERLLTSSRAMELTVKILAGIVGGWSTARHALPPFN